MSQSKVIKRFALIFGKKSYSFDLRLSTRHKKYNTYKQNRESFATAACLKNYTNKCRWPSSTVQAGTIL